MLKEIINLNGTEEEIFDEDGRLITNTSSIAKSQINEDKVESIHNQDTSEEQFDEDGRLIINTNLTSVDIIKNNLEDDIEKNDTNKIDTVPVNSSFVSSDDYDIKFAKLNNTNKFLDITNKMYIEDAIESCGLFFIINAKDEILKMNIELTNSDGDLICESEIGKLPKNRLVLKGIQSKNMYISKKVLRSQDLPIGDENYYASIREINDDSKILSLDICDNRNNINMEKSNSFSFESAVGVSEIDISENQEDDTSGSSQNTIEAIHTNINSFESITYEELNNLNLNEPIDTKQYEINPEILNKGTLRSIETIEEVVKRNGYENDDYVEENFATELTDLDYEELKKLIPPYEMINEYSRRGTEIKSVDTISETIVEKLVCPTDIKSIIIQDIINYTPVSIDCRINDTATKLISSLVVEKIGNYYITVLNGFMNRPIYILNGEERYFEFDGSIGEFINKIQSIVCKMYSMTESEFGNLTKLVVIDEEETAENIKEDEKIKVIQRKIIFDNIVQVNGKVIIDLLNNSCNLVFNDEEGKTVKVICEGLGYKNGENVLNSIENLAEKIGYNRIVLTGLFVNSKITNKVVNEERECEIGTLSKYVSM